MIRISDITNQQNMEATMGKIEQKLNIVETVNVESKTVETTNETLPEIQAGDKKALLCTKDGYNVYIMAVANATNMIVEGCKFYLEYEGKLMIGAESELSISKEMLLRATDHSILRILNKYAINFTEDNLKIAFDRAKRFLENMPKMNSYNNSLNIQDAYAEVVRLTKHHAGQEILSGLKKGNYKYDSEGQIISIKANCLQSILDEIGCGYSKVAFCRKLAMTADHYGKEVIISNSGRYAYNETGNVRYYKFRVIKEWLNIGGAE